MLPLNSNDPYIDDNGTRSRLGDVIGSGGDLPTASPTTKGGIKVGAGLVMDGESMKTLLQVDTANMELLCGSDEIFDYYIPLSGHYKGPVYLGYEIKTTDTSGNHAKVEIFSIKWAVALDKVVESELITELNTAGVKTYENDDFSLVYNNNWILTLTSTMYDENGDTIQNASWAYSQTVDKILLKH